MKNFLMGMGVFVLCTNSWAYGNCPSGYDEVPSHVSTLDVSGGNTSVYFTQRIDIPPYSTETYLGPQSRIISDSQSHRRIIKKGTMVPLKKSFYYGGAYNLHFNGPGVHIRTNQETAGAFSNSTGRNMLLCKTPKEDEVIFSCRK